MKRSLDESIFFHQIFKWNYHQRPRQDGKHDRDDDIRLIEKIAREIYRQGKIHVGEANRNRHTVFLVAPKNREISEKMQNDKKREKQNNINQKFPLQSVHNYSGFLRHRAHYQEREKNYGNRLESKISHLYSFVPE